MKKKVTNVSASVRALLLNLAKRQGRPYNEILQYYVIERFLYRLSRSSYSELFVLKGALMLQLWGPSLARATKDVDLLGKVAHSVESTLDIMRECLRLTVPDDGLRFDANSIEGSEIRIQEKYRGARVRFRAFIGSARLQLQVDVGFGDRVVPEPQVLTYPTLLDSAKPLLLGYTPESMIAEKVHTMAVREMANTRLKDFYDIWILALRREFDGEILSEAIRTTFSQRGTELSAEPPLALSAAFFGNPVKQSQWQAFLRKARLVDDLPPIHEIFLVLRDFLVPPISAAAVGRSLRLEWPAGGPWRSAKDHQSAALPTPAES